MTCGKKQDDGKKCDGTMFKPGDKSGSMWTCPKCGNVKQS